MSYVDAIHLRHKDTIEVVERVNGQRIYQTYPAPYVFYYEHAAGSHTSIFGDPCKKASFTNWKKFRKALSEHEGERRIFESDVNPVFRCLHDRYANVDAPVLNIGLFDIEADFDAERGYAPVTDPFNKITAITIHLSHTDDLVTFALRPPTISVDDAVELASEFDNTLVFDDEKELLEAFLAIIDDVDVLSGWNSEGYDIPYLVNRIARVLGKDATKRLCLWDQFPRERKYLKFKKEHTTFDLVGRVHLDYLLLYQKHNTQQLHSYRLDYVGEIEVGENKVPYEGTLDDLYKKDFNKFIGYSRQDVALLVKIDRKRKYIELANQIAHANGVVLKTTTGSVALVEQAIINEMHGFGFVVPNRRRDEAETVERAIGDDEEEEDGRTPVVGAYVAVPKFGLHDYVACIDINSLYPSTIRALNMSPETIVAQLRPDATMALVQQRIAEGTPRAEAWDGLFATLEYECVMAKDDEHEITVDFEDGSTRVMTGAQLNDLIFGENSHLCISANGTIFKTDRDGMIPMLLAKWYSQRQEMQGKQKEFAAMAKGVEVDDELLNALSS